MIYIATQKQHIIKLRCIYIDKCQLTASCCQQNLADQSIVILTTSYSDLVLWADCSAAMSHIRLVSSQQLELSPFWEAVLQLQAKLDVTHILLPVCSSALQSQSCHCPLSEMAFQNLTHYIILIVDEEISLQNQINGPESWEPKPVYQKLQLLIITLFCQLQFERNVWNGCIFVLHPSHRELSRWMVGVQSAGVPQVQGTKALYVRERLQFQLNDNIVHMSCVILKVTSILNQDPDLSLTLTKCFVCLT